MPAVFGEMQPLETHEEFKKAQKIGFDYFQGYFFCRPELIKGQGDLGFATEPSSNQIRRGNPRVVALCQGRHGGLLLPNARPEMVNLARVQGGRQIQTGGILLIFRGLEFVAQRRNRVIGAVSGWALPNTGSK
jgi:hypothetical protein